MRGLFIQNSIEYRLNVQGDTFEQGQSVVCELKIINRAGSPVILSAPTLRLALGDHKAVKAKSAEPFESVSAAEIERGYELAPGAELSQCHTFVLDANAAISDKSRGLYLIYGDSADAAQLGQLPLSVSPHKHLRAVFDTIATVLSFLPKGESSKNGWTSAKLKPPESREMSFVDELNLSARFIADEALEVNFVFTVKKLDGSQTKVSVKKAKTEVNQIWEKNEYLFGGDFVRQEYVEAKIQEALAQVRSGL
jgi:hypothetical protein